MTRRLDIAAIDDDVVDAIDHAILCGQWPWPPSARWWRGSSRRSRARRARAARLKAPGGSFHIDGASSKWISALDLASQPQASSALAVSRIPRHDDRRTRGGAIFATRFGIGAIGSSIAGHLAGVPGLDVGVVARRPHLA